MRQRNGKVNGEMTDRLLKIERHRIGRDLQSIAQPFNGTATRQV